MTLSSELKQHIETYIDDIEKGNLTNSIIYCPMDIMSDYLDTLRMIDEPIPGHLIPFTRISCYLASQYKGGHMYNMEMRGIGDETYTFDFPWSSVTGADINQVQRELSNCCPSNFVHVNYEGNHINQIITVRVSIAPASRFTF